MRLSNEEIINLTFGYAEYSQGEDGIHFYHLTKNSIEKYYAISEKLGARSKSSTGVMLDFHTDSDFVFLTLSGGQFDVKINGLLHDRLIFENGKAGTFTVNLPSGENRFTLVFPSHTEGVISEVQISDNAKIRAHKYDMKMLFLGDSITQGYHSRFDCNSYAHRVSDFFNAERLINGVGGMFFKADIFEKSDFDPDVVIIAFGTNDIKHYKTFDAFYKNAYGYINAVKSAYSGKKIFGIIPVWRLDFDTVHNMGTFDVVLDALKKLYNDLGITAFNGYELIPHFPEYFADEIHPNDLGFSFYAQNLILKLKEYI